MSIVKRCFNQPAQSMLRACYVLVLILAWQVTNAPLMSRFGSTVLQFPQVVFNGGSTTSFNINNPSSTKTISVTVQLYSRQGAPLANQQVSLMPGASETVVFGDVQLSLVTGWAELKSDDEFIATEFFQLFQGGSRVGVLPSPASEEIRFFGFVNDQFKSGLAIHNPSATEATQFTVRLKDKAGQEPVSEKTVTLAALQSQASFLDENELFGSALSSFEGVVEISVFVATGGGALLDPGECQWCGGNGGCRSAELRRHGPRRSSATTVPWRRTSSLPSDMTAWEPSPPRRRSTPPTWPAS